MSEASEPVVGCAVDSVMDKIDSPPLPLDQYSFPIRLRVEGLVDLTDRLHTKMAYLQMVSRLGSN